MAAVDITEKITVMAIQRDAMLGKPTDDYSATPTTFTVTYVVTPGSSVLAPTSITVDYSET